MIRYQNFQWLGMNRSIPENLPPDIRRRMRDRAQSLQIRNTTLRILDMGGRTERRFQHMCIDLCQLRWIGWSWPIGVPGSFDKEQRPLLGLKPKPMNSCFGTNDLRLLSPQGLGHRGQDL